MGEVHGTSLIACVSEAVQSLAHIWVPLIPSFSKKTRWFVIAAILAWKTYDVPTTRLMSLISSSLEMESSKHFDEAIAYIPDIFAMGVRNRFE